jgi:hypothetical protein
MSTCKACGEEILFLRTPAGKFLPVDADSFGPHQITKGVTIVTEAGSVIRGGALITGTVYGYVPHWATCSHPDQFRKER